MMGGLPGWNVWGRGTQGSGSGKWGNTMPHRPARGADAGWVPDPMSQAPGNPCEAGNSGTMPRNLKPCNITLFSFSKHSNLALQGPLYSFCSRHWITAQTTLQCRAFCPSCCECVSRPQLSVPSGMISAAGSFLGPGRVSWASRGPRPGTAWCVSIKHGLCPPPGDRCWCTR